MEDKELVIRNPSALIALLNNDEENKVLHYVAAFNKDSNQIDLDIYPDLETAKHRYEMAKSIESIAYERVTRGTFSAQEYKESPELFYSQSK